jgi:hypothetical protein
METLQLMFYLRLAQLQLRVRNLYNNEPQENENIPLLWNLTPRTFAGRYQRYEGTFCLYRQGAVLS